MLKSKIILFASCLGLFLMGCSDDQEATPQPEAPYVNVNQHAYNDKGTDHRRLNRLEIPADWTPEQLLHQPDIRTAVHQMRCK